MPELSEIIRLAARGDGFSADGRHVHGAAPGDLIDAAGAVIERGPHHIDPACIHFGRCGGCQLQHVDDGAYRIFLADRISHALAQQGVEVEHIHQAHLSPPHSRRRASLRALKRQGRVTIGFNEGESHAVIDVEQCPVLAPDLFALLKPLHVLCAHLLAERSAAGITMTRADQGIDLMIGPIKADDLRSLELLTGFAVERRLARLSVDHGYGAELVHMPEPPTVTLSGVPVALPPASFLQATPDGEQALVKAVETVTVGASRIADLFAGLGTFTLPLSRSAQLLAVDAAGNAIEALQQAAGRVARPITAKHRDLFRSPLDAKELNRCDAVVVDPPRAGARAQSEELAKSDVPRIAMVSCNPNSFARDAKTLVEGGYRLTELWPVGQFRWSTHVELVAAFQR